MTPPLETPRRSPRTGPRRPGGIVVRALIGGLVGVAAVGCGDDGPIDPDSTRFGQVGDMRFVMETPLALGAGRLRQELEWGDDGIWILRESVSYEGEVGDEGITAISTDPDVSAGAYAGWITQVNEQPGLDLFVEELDPFLDPTCTDLQARIILTIRDRVRNEEISWTRCAQGPLSSLTPTGAKPDPAASRVANAGLLARNATVGERFVSAYVGTVPFATIERGEDSGATPGGPILIEDEALWSEFWAAHTNSQGAPPPVDFQQDLVLVAAVGERFEAGDSVEVRRILAGAQSTVVQLVERVPGDFCAPAERRQFPYHIVRFPRVPLPVRFTDVPVERVPCG